MLLWLDKSTVSMAACLHGHSEAQVTRDTVLSSILACMVQGQCSSHQCRVVTCAKWLIARLMPPRPPTVTVTRACTLPQTLSDLRPLRPILLPDGTFPARLHCKLRPCEVAHSISQRPHWMDQSGWTLQVLSLQCVEFLQLLEWALEESRNVVPVRAPQCSLGGTPRLCYSIMLVRQPVRERLLSQAQPLRHR